MWQLFLKNSCFTLSEWLRFLRPLSLWDLINHGSLLVLFSLRHTDTSEVSLPFFFSFYHQNFHQTGKQNLVVSSCTGTQRNETLTNCVTTPCMDMKTIGIPPCTGTPGQPPKLSLWVIKYVTHEKKNFVLLSSTTFCVCTWVCNHGKKKICVATCTLVSL